MNNSCIGCFVVMIKLTEVVQVIRLLTCQNQLVPSALGTLRGVGVVLKNFQPNVFGMALSTNGSVLCRVR